jgi:hypothetical protein
MSVRAKYTARRENVDVEDPAEKDDKSQLIFSALLPSRWQWRTLS